MADIVQDEVYCRNGEAMRSKGLFLKNSRGFTLVEVLIGVAILITVASIAVPGYFKMIKTAKVARASGDITSMAAQISIYRFQIGAYPESLKDVGLDQRQDPWGRPYYYHPIDTTKKNPEGARKDRNLHPLNSDFDLYSAGEDGNTQLPITAHSSQDDVIRANNGGYVGLASNY
jgi:general secretion pathway protein G